MLELNLEDLASDAAAGDLDAAEELLRAIVDDVHRLALRMLWHPIDAENATEEILIEVLSQLSDLAGDVRTRALRVAAKFLLRTYESPMERQEWTFEEMGQHLDRALADEIPVDVPFEVRPVCAEEVKIGCMQTMLLCLDRPDRLAYVLADVFGLDGASAARVVGIEPALFRELLQNARDRLHAFMGARCGVINAASPCRCTRRLGRDLRTGRVDPRRLLFVVPDRPSRPFVGSPERSPSDPVRVFRDQELRPAPPWIVERVCAFLRMHEPELLRA
jgi:DNA-directed RNA polymerase specialized sigma24 family protein